MNIDLSCKNIYLYRRAYVKMLCLMHEILDDIKKITTKNMKIT